MNISESLEQHRSPEIRETQTIDWVDISIRLASRNDLLSLKILEKLYISPGMPFILDELVRSVIRPFNKRKKMTVWRRITYLRSLGLLETDHGKPLSIYPARNIERANISRLLQLCYSKMLGEAHVQS